MVWPEGRSQGPGWREMGRLKRDSNAGRTEAAFDQKHLPTWCSVMTYMDFPGGLVVKNSPAVWETWVRSLGQEDPLEKEMAIHSSVLAWRIPRMEKPSRLQSTGSQRVGHG